MKRHGLGMVACAVVILMAAGASPTGAQQPGTIKIGLIVSLTGRVAPNGRDMVNGLTLALAQLNHRVGGREVRVIVEDERHSVPASKLTSLSPREPHLRRRQRTVGLLSGLEVDSLRTRASSRRP